MRAQAALPRRAPVWFGTGVSGAEPGMHGAARLARSVLPPHESVSESETEREIVGESESESESE